MSRRVKQLLTGILVVGLPIALLALGIFLGGHPDDLPSFIRSAFVSDSGSPVVNEALADVKRDYYRPITQSELSDAAISGIVASLKDRFSHYLTPEQYGSFDKSAQFSGIGVEVAPEHSGLLIGRVFDQSPAKRSGLKVGDVIVAVNGKSLTGVPSTTATGLIEGPPGTDVTLTLHNNGKNRTVTVTREVVTTPVVASQMITYKGIKIGVVELSTFSVLGVHGQVRLAVNSLLAQGAQGIVLDLRQNGGGLVEEAQLVASIFIPKGTIVTTRGRTQPTVVLKAVGGAISPKVPMVVLVDRGTASASEIVTGALQDDGRAQVVGTHTFGKGVFQEVKPLSNGGALDITVGEYYTPNGRNLGGGGVTEGAGITPNIPLSDKIVDTNAGLMAALKALAAKVQ
jgi:carboxyl-terminal processing protease